MDVNATYLLGVYFGLINQSTNEGQIIKISGFVLMIARVNPPSCQDDYMLIQRIDRKSVV